MSTFTQNLYRTAATSTKGMVTGEPGTPVRHTWAEVHAHARRIAGSLAAAGIGPGDAVTVLAGSPVDIAPAIQGAWMRGASVTMLHQPTPRTDLGVWAHETMTVLGMVEAKVVLLGSPFEPVKPVLVENGVTVLEMAELDDGADTEPLEVGEAETALLQLTSGSTGHPKAVRITHANLGANIEGMRLAGALDPVSDVAVSWLPLFHDMGMVGFLTLPMTLGIELVTVTPLDFLASPLLWMELVSRYGGTLTAAPNFAYAVAGKRLARAEEGSLDLSTLRFALNGAEPIDPVAVAAFTDAGARFGLDPGCVVCAYGMAEVTLAVSFAELGAGLTVDHIDADALEKDRRAVVVPADAARARAFPTLGPLLHGLEARVVDGEGTVLDVRGVGVIQLRGAPATPGYITVDGPLATQDAEGWLDTGDEGYLTEAGHVVVCGRVKDVIIMGGRNIYPTDIERAAGEVDGVRAGNVVAVRIEAGDRRETFGVALESARAGDPVEVARIRKEVTAAVVSAVGVRPRTVSVLAPGTLPKTPSGKLRRSSSADLVAEPTEA
ncbi:fatty acyl-AMP ligase [Rhodococcus antarcticus]|uniref:Fatty acyl-AMP ligase n=1 Tax=Rhodococcus antarcticus TaxID=2987751 RepID=A0ABY6NY77_9NOCA|nr:fatty acyl-AMP ligase [Rhodococcus antarcticus]UZJ24081.1 fatty acyl-AMP ligase [Rhodococcus antarcticus]